jgi:hypothetical protein
MTGPAIIITRREASPRKAARPPAPVPQDAREIARRQSILQVILDRLYSEQMLTLALTNWEVSLLPLLLVLQLYP